MTLERTRALMARLAAALGLPALPADDTGGFHLAVGTEIDIYIYGGDDETVLIVGPIAPLPLQPEYGLVVYLLRNNMFDADSAPFQIAVDEGGALIIWGRVPIASLDGASLALLIDRLGQRVEAIRAEVAGAPDAAVGAPKQAPPVRRS